MNSLHSTIRIPLLPRGETSLPVTVRGARGVVGSFGWRAPTRTFGATDNNLIRAQTKADHHNPSSLDAA
jgi:hypothetical protein